MLAYFIFLIIYCADNNDFNIIRLKMQSYKILLHKHIKYKIFCFT